jgi:RNA polymerase sigma factor (sigma-70 family)
LRPQTDWGSNEHPHWAKEASHLECYESPWSRRCRNKSGRWKAGWFNLVGFAAEVLWTRTESARPEELYAHKERRRILFEAMHDLTPGMREAIKLRELGERSTEETAQIMGISASAVKARVFHGRKILRERLQDHAGRALTSGKDTSRMIGNRRRVRSQGPVECNAWSLNRMNDLSSD